MDLVRRHGPLNVIVAERLPPARAAIGSLALPQLFCSGFVSLGLALWRAAAAPV